MYQTVKDAAIRISMRPTDKLSDQNQAETPG